jgi:hypothetical protein
MKPAADRALFRLLYERRVTTIVEIGLGTGQRAERMIRLAMKLGDGLVRYTGIDLFEARPPFSPGLTYKCAHRLLMATGAQVKLVPGDPLSALGRVANGLRGTDLLIVSADQDEAALSRAWFFVPRMLHADSRICLEEPQAANKGTRFRVIQPEDVELLAAAGSLKSAA